MKKVAVLCSGGDSPGMNCAIRAVVRSGIFHGLEIIGVKRGYAGLLKKEFIKMDLSSVGNVLQRGGTILQTSRSKEFREEKYRAVAVQNLKNENIDALIVIGGDGSFNGAHALWKEHQFPVIGIPATIDNDISNTDYTIGFDTAVETCIQAVDKIRDTAHSHARIFLVEVMGRNSSAIALKVGVCTGAENILLPNSEIDYQKIVDDINRGLSRGKESSIVIVAEGPVSGRSYEVQKKLKQDHHMDSHVCILGHVQRGGSPSGTDRLIASEMGHLAIKAVMSGKFHQVTIYREGKVGLDDLLNCITKNDKADTHLVMLASQLSI